MKKNGQALVEFIIVMPLIIYMLMGVVDLCTIMYNKNNLESKMEDVVTLYKKGRTINELKEFVSKDENNSDVLISTSDEYVTITIIKKQTIVTPGLGKVLGNPYKVKVERVILNE